MLNEYQAEEVKSQGSDQSENYFDVESAGIQFWQELLNTLNREWANKINSDNN